MLQTRKSNISRSATKPQAAQARLCKRNSAQNNSMAYLSLHFAAFASECEHMDNQTYMKCDIRFLLQENCIGNCSLYRTWYSKNGFIVRNNYFRNTTQRLCKPTVGRQMKYNKLKERYEPFISTILWILSKNVHNRRTFKTLYTFPVWRYA